MTFINVQGYTTFTGYVKDKASNAISGATVLIADSYGYILGYTSTSSSGYYSFSVSLSGHSPYYLSASKTGYETGTKTVTGGGRNDFSLYGYVDGYVKDSQNVAISGATVKAYRYSGVLGSTTTQSNGYYYIQIANHPTKITAEKHGFRDYSQTISTTGRFNFNMKALKAIIVGISDYSSGTDLNYCDEDASDWYDQLDDLGYDCEIYGDGHPGNYPRYDGLATESNVRSAIQSLDTNVGSGDTVCFIFSGHGGTSWFQQYLLMQDNSKYKETEIEDDFEDFDSGVDIFFFFDSCNSGGIISSLDDMPNEDYIYVATTCTKDGYGYDSPTHSNGLWTYYFLEYSWIDNYSGSRSTSMETVFDYALSNYPLGGDDTPQEHDGSASSFYL
ncbi:MAG: carboxypeptidase regulatory-like domain-containing protein [Candidatus Heimdallarchaeota archaeon]|nr:carboxypeptidase regulatory-like domain-containing protein [Candidatus Heimdallarchaeota archaeon]